MVSGSNYNARHRAPQLYSALVLFFLWHCDVGHRVIRRIAHDARPLEAEGKETVLKSLDKAASSLRQKLGESLASVQQFATPLEQATTSSLDALKEFSLGRALHLKFHETEAIPYLKRAVELDPNFATAYATLAVCYSNTVENKQALQLYRKAYDLRERASEREKSPSQIRAINHRTR